MNDAIDIMNVSSAPETSAGVSIGSSTVRHTRARLAPRFVAASSSDPSNPANAADTDR